MQRLYINYIYILSLICECEHFEDMKAMPKPEIIYKGIGNASRAPIESMLDRAYHPTMCESHVL